MKKAFTLIEILIVVILLGILAAVVIPQFVDQSATVADGAAKTDISTLNAAWQQYVAVTTASGDAAKIAAMTAASATYATATAKLVEDNYIDKAPVAQGDCAYTFDTNADAAKCKFSATLSNGTTKFPE